MDIGMDSVFTSPPTPIVDERAYSPVSAAGDEGIHKLLNDEIKTTSHGFVFTHTPLPRDNTPGLAGRKRPMEEPRTSGSDVDRVLDAMAAMERRFSTEVSSLREEVKSLQHSVEQLCNQTEQNSGEARIFTEHVQLDIVKGVNHLSGLIQLRQEKIHKASFILQDLL